MVGSPWIHCSMVILDNRVEHPCGGPETNPHGYQEITNFGASQKLYVDFQLHEDQHS